MSENSKYTKFIAKKVDRNQPEVVRAFRKLGAVVHHLHMVGGGCFDLLIAVDFLNILVEVKDGLVVPSKREFTPQQIEFHRDWTGLRAVATTIYDVQCIMRDARALVQIFREASDTNGIALKVTGSKESMYNQQKRNVLL